MLNYKAAGTVVASALLFADIHLVVVWRGLGKPLDKPLADDQGKPANYVVSRYTEGATDWHSGTYCDNYPEALDAFVKKLQETRAQLGKNGLSHT